VPLGGGVLAPGIGLPFPPTMEGGGGFLAFRVKEALNETNTAATHPPLHTRYSTCLNGLDVMYRGYLALKKQPPPRTTVGPQA